MNINGYAFVPRLAIAVIGYIVMFFNPTVFSSGSPSPFLITMIILGLTGMVYSLFLMIYGYVVTPSESKIDANSASE